VAKVRSAIHVRTGQRAAAAAIDEWLRRHDVAVTDLADVYEACVHLLRHCDQIADLAFLGADWLTDDEFGLIAHIRQTWPRTVVVVYGGAPAPVRVDLLPLTRGCYGRAALEALLASSPAHVVEGLLPERAPAEAGRTPGTPPVAAARTPSAAPAAGEASVTRRDPPESELPRTESLRSILTAEELSALLDQRDEG